MPEGDTLFKIARRLDRVFVGKELSSFHSPDPALQKLATPGLLVEQVEARGKHLLIHFSGGAILHTHLRREGSWRVYRSGEARPTGPRVVAVLAAGGWEAVCIGAPTAEILSPWTLRSHPALSRLGPDILAESFRRVEVINRLRTLPQQAIGVALLDQRSCSGIGNIYKSEVLFMQSVHPLRKVGQMSDAELSDVLGCARKWLVRNLTAGRRRTRWGPGPGLWVYRREGQRCLRCDGRVAMLRQGPKRRSTYYCSSCQLA